MEVVTRAAAASLPNKAEATSGMGGPGAACVDMCVPPEKFDTFCSGLGGRKVPAFHASSQVLPCVTTLTSA